MNVSSLVVKTKPEHLDSVLGSLRESGVCDVHFHDGNGKIIVTVEGSSSIEEMNSVRAILGIPHVVSAELAYTYCEEELEEARRKLGADFPGRALMS